MHYIPKQSQCVGWPDQGCTESEIFDSDSTLALAEYTPKHLILHSTPA